MAQLVLENSVDSQAHIKANGRVRLRNDYSFEYTVCQLGTHGVDGTPLSALCAIYAEFCVIHHHQDLLFCKLNCAIY